MTIIVFSLLGAIVGCCFGCVWMDHRQHSAACRRPIQPPPPPPSDAYRHQPWPKGQEPPGWPRYQTPCAPEPCATTQLQKEKPTEQCTVCKLWTDPSHVESGTCIWCIAKQLKKENERLTGKYQAALESWYNAELREATARESALRSAIAIVKNQRAGMDTNGLRFAQERIESLITTQASECEWVINEDGTYETSCLKMFTFTHGTPAENKFSHCPYCGKPIAQSNEVAKPLTGNDVLDAAAAAAWRERNGGTR